MQTDTEVPVFLADLLSAVGEPTRLRIMNLLQVQPLCVCDLQNVMGLSEPLVSRHLARLRFAHLVIASRDGNRMIYRVTAADSPALTVLRHFLVEVGRSDPCLQRDLDRLKKCSRCTSLHHQDQKAVSAPRRR